MDLQISVEAQQGLERRLRVQVPADHFEHEVENRLRSVSKSAKLKGFRPGKIPANVIKQHYGVQVRQEVVQELVQSSYSEALEKEQLRPAGHPAIEVDSIEEGKDFAYTATFEIFPEFTLKGMDSFKITEPETTVNDADVDDMFETLRKQRTTWKAVDRKAADGDQITADFLGTLKGEPFEGGKGESVPITLGGGQMLPDFEKGLIGLKAGDEKVVKVKFPKDYHAGHLAGEKVEFAVSVKDVAEPELPEIDEEFVKSFAVKSGSIDDFRAEIRQNMEREAQAKVKADIKQQIMEQLLKANPIELPGALVEQESASIQQETMRNMGVNDVAQAPPVESFREAAEPRVRLGLLVSAVIREGEIELDREILKQKVDELCAPYDKPDELRKMYFQNPQLLSSVENVVMEEQVVDWLISRAKVKKKAVAFKELVNG